MLTHEDQDYTQAPTLSKTAVRIYVFLLQVSHFLLLFNFK